MNKNSSSTTTSDEKLIKVEKTLNKTEERKFQHGEPIIYEYQTQQVIL